MADYCSSSDILARMPESGLVSSTDYEDAITALITSASRTIDRTLGKWDNFFYPSTADGTYYYNGDGSDQLWLDPFVSITSVSISESGGVASTDYTLLSSTDWYAFPANDTPTLRLDMDYLNGSYSLWPSYRKSVKVIGIRGHSATPPLDITEACIMQTVRWLQRAKQAYQDQGASTEQGSLTYANLDPDIARLVSRYVVEYGITA